MPTISTAYSEGDVLAYVFGDELRQARKARGWTRKQLQAHLTSGVSLQTLATYELGTRQCSVARLVELCRALGTGPAELLDAVDTRMSGRPDTITVDLRSLAATNHPALATARQWATTRLATHDSTAIPVAELSADALDRLAELCALEPTALITHLRPHIRTTPRGTHR